MSNTSEAYANFAENSYCGRFIEEPALNRAIPTGAYTAAASILDIGCGSGRTVDYHVRRGAAEASITGVDPDPTNIALSRERFPGAHFIQRNIQDVSLEEHSIDIATAQLSLRYLDNSELAVLCHNIARALRKGGLFFILDAHPARYGLSDGFDRYLEEGPREVAAPWGGSDRYNYRTMSTYANTLIGSGLAIARFDECPIWAAGTGEAYAKDFARYSASPARFAILATKLS